MDDEIMKTFREGIFREGGITQNFSEQLIRFPYLLRFLQKKDLCVDFGAFP